MSSAIIQVDCPKCKHEILVALKIQQRARKVNGEKKDSEFHKFADWAFSELYKIDPKDSAAVTAAYQRYGRSINQILAFAGGREISARNGTKAIGRWLQHSGLSWSLDTVAKWFPDWMQYPKRFE